MQSIKILAICLIAFLTLAAVCAESAAAAQPKFVTKSGAFPVGFSGTSGAAKFETEEGTAVNCTASKVVAGAQIVGEYKVNKVKVEYSGCSAFGGLATCTTTGQSAGIVLSSELEGELEWIGLEEVGKQQPFAIWLWPSAGKAKGTVFATFGCKSFSGTTTVTIRNATSNGGLVCELLPKNGVNVFAKEMVMSCAMVGKAVQNPSWFRNPAKCSEEIGAYLEAEGVGLPSPFKLQRSGLEVSETLTAAEEVKVQAKEHCSTA
jgi:hypothetical protein